MLAAIVDVHGHATIVQHIRIGLLEIAGMDEDMSGEIRDVDAPDRRMERCGVGRVPDAEADDQHGLRIVLREKRDVRKSPHVALSQRLGPGHRVPVRRQDPSSVRRFRHGNDLGHAFAEGEKAPFSGRKLLRPSNDVIGR